MSDKKQQPSFLDSELDNGLDSGLDSQLIGGQAQQELVDDGIIYNSDFLGAWISPESQTSSAVIARIQEEYRKFVEAHKAYSPIKLISIRGDWMPNEEMLMFVLLDGTAAYVHPIFFSTGKGAEIELPQTSGGTTFVSDAHVINMKGSSKESLFKVEVGNQLRSAGLIDEAVHNKLDVVICGTSVLDPKHHNTITANKLIGVASIDIQNTHGFKTKTVANGSLLSSHLTNTELELRIGTTGEANNVYGSPVFGPVVVEVWCKRKGGSSGLAQRGGQLLAKAYGYMEVSRVRRDDVAKLDLPKSEEPFLQATFNVRSLSFVDGSYLPSPNTVLLVMSMIAHPTSVTLFNDKVIQYKVTDSGCKHYAYPAIGYLAPAEKGKKPAPFTQIYTPRFAEISERAVHARRVFMPSVRVSFDVFDAAPYSSAFKILATSEGLSKAMRELTGDVNFRNVNIGIVSCPLPYMTYVRDDGKERDVAELANTYSMLTMFDGNLTAVAEEYETVVGRRMRHQEDGKNLQDYNRALVFCETRLVSSGDANLLDQFTRIHVNPQVLMTVINRLVSNGVTLKYKDVSSSATGDLYALDFSSNGVGFSFNY